MKRLILILILPLLLGASSMETAPTKVNFYKGSLAAAQEKAREEGKLLFIDFYASWCSPCRLMDEYTFTDSELAKYMDDKYIPVKINIDDFDGFAYKQQYNINLLPTLMVMNCDGKEIERKEEGLVPSTMTKFLSKHFVPSNICEKPIEVPKPIIVEPEPPKLPVSTPDTPKPPSTISTPTIPKPPTTEPSKPIETTPDKPVVPSPKPISASGSLESSLFRFQVQRQPSKGYSVQTGVFAEYGNVLREVDKLQRVFLDKPIIVYIGSKDGKTVYKILVGEFNTRSAAYSYKEHMKKKGSPGLIKNLEFIQ